MGRKIALNRAVAITKVLEFYGALGIERLPLDISSAPASGGPSRKAGLLRALREDMGDCRKCRLHKERKNLVYGEGSPNARIMFVGEAPGRDEDAQGRPFVGEAGVLLTRLISRMGEEHGKKSGEKFGRDDVYIGNIIKCRPPQNRDPHDDEVNACLPFIVRQIEIISPDVIVSLGRISAQTLLGLKTQISKLRGNFFDFKGIPLMPTYHPAYLLRTPRDKVIVWDDAMKVLRKLQDDAR